MIVLTWWAMAWTIAGVRASLAAYSTAVPADTRRQPAAHPAAHPADGVPPALPSPGARVIYLPPRRFSRSVGKTGR